jgi:limonene-1,2-epoxide hydrolase
MSRDPEQLVSEFVATWERGDADEMASFFTDDGEYQNVPRDPAVGRDAVRAYMERLTEFLEITGVEVHRQLASGSIVVNERTDHFLYNGTPVSMPVCGVFEIDGDRIKQWRDYADSAQLAQP